MPGGPTFVLVHGGSHGSWCWERMIPHLDHPALAVDLPGRAGRPGDLRRLRVADFVTAIVEDIERADLHDVVLVGHSMAGVSVPQVAARLADRVRALVLIAASVPPAGASLLRLLPPHIRATVWVTATVGRFRPLPLPRAMARRMFCNDMSEEERDFTLSRICLDAQRISVEKVDRPPLPAALPRIYIRFLRDRSLAPELAPVMAANLGGADVVDIDAGHNGMITRPAEVAAVLNRLASGS
ncbi:MAG: alpha/beta hydrolase fold [Streptosporangiaceae bacterium]|jgi:pimeloyl-ACP methyl ester carboxylesterase|nr:alpha/beta hydrolase fold [Streptosporangiaceae bacterium]